MPLTAEYTALPSISHILVGLIGLDTNKIRECLNRPRALHLLQAHKLGGDCGIEPQCGLMTLTAVSIVLLFIELIMRKMVGMAGLEPT